MAVIGGTFFDGGAYPPEVQGKYIYADFVLGWVRLLTFNDDNQVIAEEDFDQFVAPKGVASIGRAPDGTIYAVDRGSETILKYVYAAP